MYCNALTATARDASTSRRVPMKMRRRILPNKRKRANLSHGEGMKTWKLILTLVLSAWNIGLHREQDCSTLLLAAQDRIKLQEFSTWCLRAGHEVVHHRQANLVRRQVDHCGIELFMNCKGLKCHCFSLTSKLCIDAKGKKEYPQGQGTWATTPNTTKVLNTTYEVKFISKSFKGSHIAKKRHKSQHDRPGYKRIRDLIWARMFAGCFNLDVLRLLFWLFWLLDCCLIVACSWAGCIKGSNLHPSLGALQIMGWSCRITHLCISRAHAEACLKLSTIWMNLYTCVACLYTCASAAIHGWLESPRAFDSFCVFHVFHKSCNLVGSKWQSDPINSSCQTPPNKCEVLQNRHRFTSNDFFHEFMAFPTMLRCMLLHGTSCFALPRS